MLLTFIHMENKMEMILKYDLLEKYYLYSKILFWFYILFAWHHESSQSIKHNNCFVMFWNLLSSPFYILLKFYLSPILQHVSSAHLELSLDMIRVSYSISFLYLALH